MTLMVYSCGPSVKEKIKMEEARIVEMVLWKSKEGIAVDDAKASIVRLNEFVRQQPGFISRKTSIAEDGRFLDIVLWADLAAAKSASEKAMQNEEVVKIFSSIDEEEMIFQHFEIFNSTD